MKKCVVFVMMVVGFVVVIVVYVQSSVILYGIVDNGLVYQNNVVLLMGVMIGGYLKVLMFSGVWVGSCFGLKGSEDFGGGMKVIFQLEVGVNFVIGVL